MNAGGKKSYDLTTLLPSNRRLQVLRMGGIDVTVMPAWKLLLPKSAVVRDFPNLQEAMIRNFLSLPNVVNERQRKGLCYICSDKFYSVMRTIRQYVVANFSEHVALVDRLHEHGAHLFEHITDDAEIGTHSIPWLYGWASPCVNANSCCSECEILSELSALLSGWSEWKALLAQVQQHWGHMARVKHQFLANEKCVSRVRRQANEEDRER